MSEQSHVVPLEGGHHCGDMDSKDGPIRCILYGEEDEGDREEDRQSMTLAPAEFAALFTTERELSAPDGTLIHTAIRHIGDLHIVSGALVACDPALAEPIPIGERFPVGIFPVHLVITTLVPQRTLLHHFLGRMLPPSVPDQRIALAAITFCEEPVASWREATVRSAPGLAGPRPYHYAVDSATGCYMDLLAAERAALAEGDLFELVDIDHQNPQGEPTWLTMSLRDAPPLNIVAFNSGWGDGAYPVFIGYTASNRVARVVTDFRVL